MPDFKYWSANSRLRMTYRDKEYAGPIVLSFNPVPEDDSDLEIEDILQAIYDYYRTPLTKGRLGSYIEQD